MNQKHLESLECRTLLTATLEAGTLSVTGTDNAETITISDSGAGQILVDITGQTQESFAEGDVTAINIDALGGADTVAINVNRPTTTLGGQGNDTITGSDGGADSVIGQQGADTANLRGGDDTFVWNPGDGSDSVDGDAGEDILQFNGSTGDEIFEISPLGNGRVKFFRNLGNINMDMGTTEHFIVNPLGGADFISVRDTTGTDLTRVDIELEGTSGSGTPDGAIDQLQVFGSSAADTITITGDATSGIAITGTSAAINITHTDATDTLKVDGRGGSDTLDASALLADAAKLTLLGNTGHDTMLGGAGDDTFFGGAGNDSVDGNKGNDTANLDAGNDTFIWDPGDGSDIVEGGADFDTLRFNGAGGDEVMEASANGTRLKFTRDLGSINMDVNGTEKLDVRALGGNDSVTILDISATDLSQVFVDGGEGNDTLTGGAERDTFVGGAGEDTLRGNAGIDVLNGNTEDGDDGASDRVLGGPSNDFATFGDGDRFDLGAGSDTLIYNGTDSADQITVDFRVIGNLPRASFITNLGNKLAVFSNGEIIRVNAGRGNDSVIMSNAAGLVWHANFFGGVGNDVLVGGDLDDTLTGEEGRDSLIGLGGTDVLTGGANVDVEIE